MAWRRAGGHEIDVTPANVANTVFDVGASGGKRCPVGSPSPKNGQLTTWQSYTVTAPIDTGPAETVSKSDGVSWSKLCGVFVRPLIAECPVGRAASDYDVWNTGSGGGYFDLNGSELPGANRDNYVTAAQSLDS